MIHQRPTTLTLALIVADLAFAVIVLVVTSILRFGLAWATHWRSIVAEPLILVAAYGLIWIAVLSASGLYQFRARWTLRREAQDLARATLVMAALVLALLFWFRLPDISRTYLGLLFPIQFVATLASRIIVRRAVHAWRAGDHNVRHVVVVGAGRRGREFAALLDEHDELGVRIVGFIDDDPELTGTGWRHLGSLDRFADVLHAEVVDEVAMCLPFSQWDRADRIIAVCEDEGKIVRVPFDLMERAFSTGHVEDIGGTTVFSIVSGPDRLMALAAKRGLDILVSVGALVVLGPLMVTVAGLIRVLDGAPILFVQERVGLHGRTFKVMKFRTMAPDADAHYVEVVGRSDPRAFKLTDDPRITRVGRWIRRTSLDELPQLWNVLRGEMSLVGPRPAPRREVDAYDPWHRRRLSMKPGITGLWQVTARQSDDFERRAALDLSYIDRWSLWLDIKILLRTLPAAFSGR